MAIKEIVIVMCGGLFFLLACETKKRANQKYFDFDSLISEQVAVLGNRKIGLEKFTFFNSISLDTMYFPSAKNLTLELEIFRQLDVVNKSVGRKGVLTQNSLSDNHSNLKINRLTSNSTPIKEIKIFYLNKPEKLRKIEALISENNILSRFERKLVMEFEEKNGKPMLSSYAINGVEKMIFRDSIRFEIKSKITP